MAEGMTNSSTRIIPESASLFLATMRSPTALPVRSPRRRDGVMSNMAKTTTRYVVVIDGKPGAFGMWVPDMPGCTSMGKTLDELLHDAQEALRLWAEDATEDGEAIPVPRSFDEVYSDPKVTAAIREGAALAIVPLLIDSGRSVKANLSMDTGLLSAIDDAAAARGLTRSAFLSSAAREKISAEG